MYIISNAFKNLFRNKERNLLMAVIILSIIITTAISMIIQTTTPAVIEDYKSRFGAEIILSLDSDKVNKLFAQGKSAPSITTRQTLDFGESELLQSVSYQAQAAVSLKDLKAFGDDGEKGDSTDNLPNAYVKASTNTNISSDFVAGKRKITEGRVFADKGECIVSEQFAELNNLQVGDIVTVRAYTPDDPMEEELKITGIYSDLTMIGVTGIVAPLNNRNNDILTTLDTLLEMELFQTLGAVEPIYYLRNPDFLPEFRNELIEKGLPDYYNVSTDQSSYEKVVGPVEGLSKITFIFMIVVLILGSAILLLISAMAIRERKYEIGVLRAMGMKKIKVAMGLVTEMLMITVFALIIGLGAASVSAQPVADILLEQQIEYAEDNQTQPGFSIAGFDKPDQTPLSELRVNLNFEAVLEIILVSLFLSILTSAAGVFRIAKYEPIKILSERT